MGKFEFRRNHFDLIRLIAAVQVAIVHGLKHFDVQVDPRLISLLDLFPGVPIFFVISGFLISASVERSTSLGSYFKNRILRIYPGLWICFAISLAMVLVLYRPSFSWVGMATWVMAQLTIGQFYNPEFLRGYGVGALNGSLWTIPIELQFYLLLPLIYAPIRRLRPVAIGLGMLALIVVNQVYIGSALGSESVLLKLFGTTIIPYLYIFLFGVLLQQNIHWVAAFLKDRAAVLLVVYLSTTALAGGIGLRCTGNYMNPLSAFTLCLLTISVGYSYTDRMSDILKGTDLSYGIYIYHMVVANMLIHLGTFTPLVNLSVMLALTIVAAFGSWKFVEKRALALKSYSLRSGASALPSRPALMHE